MSKHYTIDFTSDVIRGAHNLGTRNLLKDLSLAEVNALIEEYTQKFGSPRFVAGMILWIDKNNDTYCFSIYKNGECFDVTSLDGLKD
tara:strand:+ start:1157 stop:1417 length:261 start_codon:yes stop_codon:yes gene_type:complete